LADIYEQIADTYSLPVTYYNKLEKIEKTDQWTLSQFLDAFQRISENSFQRLVSQADIPLPSSMLVIAINHRNCRCDIYIHVAYISRALKSPFEECERIPLNRLWSESTTSIVVSFQGKGIAIRFFGFYIFLIRLIARYRLLI